MTGGLYTQTVCMCGVGCAHVPCRAACLCLWCAMCRLVQSCWLYRYAFFVHLVTLWKTVRTYKRMDLYVPCELFYGTVYNNVLGLF